MKLSNKWKTILTAVISAFLGGLGVDIAINPETPANNEITQAAPVVAETAEPEPPPAETKPEEAAEPEAAADIWKDLEFCWGGFKAGSAAVVAEIDGLKVNSGGLSYKWKNGGCEKMGAGDKGDASATVACLFCKIGNKWKGGKFDWISTSRTTRGFENIRSGYNGWQTDAIEAASAYAFVIVSKDGRKRTNVIQADK